MYLCRWLNPSAQSTWVSIYVSADEISHLHRQEPSESTGYRYFSMRFFNFRFQQTKIITNISKSIDLLMEIQNNAMLNEHNNILKCNTKYKQQSHKLRGFLITEKQ